MGLVGFPPVLEVLPEPLGFSFPESFLSLLSPFPVLFPVPLLGCVEELELAACLGFALGEPFSFPLVAVTASVFFTWVGPRFKSSLHDWVLVSC